MLQMLIIAPQALYLLLVFCAILLLYDDLVAKLLALEAFDARNALNSLVQDGFRCTRRQDVLDLRTQAGEVVLGHSNRSAVCVARRAEGDVTRVVWAHLANAAFAQDVRA